MTEPSLLDLFTDSWLANSGDDLASRAARRSLEASTYGNPELTDILTWLKLVSQAELDLHLAGAGVRGHQTDAVPFGKFIQRTGESVRELARTAFGSVKAVASLQVLAPAPGSVRVVFRSPDLPDPGFAA